MTEMFNTLRPYFRDATLFVWCLGRLRRISPILLIISLILVLFIFSFRDMDRSTFLLSKDVHDEIGSTDQKDIDQPSPPSDKWLIVPVSLSMLALRDPCETLHRAFNDWSILLIVVGGSELHNSSQVNCEMKSEEELLFADKTAASLGTMPAAYLYSASRDAEWIYAPMLETVQDEAILRTFRPPPISDTDWGLTLEESSSFQMEAQSKNNLQLNGRRQKKFVQLKPSLRNPWPGSQSAGDSKNESNVILETELDFEQSKSLQNAFNLHQHFSCSRTSVNEKVSYEKASNLSSSTLVHNYRLTQMSSSRPFIYAPFKALDAYESKSIASAKNVATDFFLSGAQNINNIFPSFDEPNKFVFCDATAPPVTLPLNLYLPQTLFNMAAYRRNAFWAIPPVAQKFLPSNWSRIVQFLLWKTGGLVTLYNYHDIVPTFATNATGAPYFGSIREHDFCTDEMVTLDQCIDVICSKFDIKLKQSKSSLRHRDGMRSVCKWFQALKSVSFVFPAVSRTSNTNKVSDNKVDQSDQVWFNPVETKQGELIASSKNKFPVNNLQTLKKLLQKTCSTESTKNRKEPNRPQLQTSWANVNLTKPPWNQFSDIVLIITLNKPIYSVIPYIELLYRPFFPQMVYCGPSLPDLNIYPELTKYSFNFVTYFDVEGSESSIDLMKHNSTKIRDFSASSFGRNATNEARDRSKNETKHASGSFNYECLGKVLRMGIRPRGSRFVFTSENRFGSRSSVKPGGYLIISDDLLALVPTLVDAPRDIVWYLPQIEVRTGDLRLMRECRLGVCDYSLRKWVWWEDYRDEALRTLEQLRSKFKDGSSDHSNSNHGNSKFGNSYHNIKKNGNSNQGNTHYINNNKGSNQDEGDRAKKSPDNIVHAKSYFGNVNYFQEGKDHNNKGMNKSSYILNDDAAKSARLYYQMRYEKRHSAHLSRLYYRCYSQLIKSNGAAHRANGAFSDMYYLPENLAQDFADLADAFVENRVFLEIAVATLLMCLAPEEGRRWWPLAGHQVSTVEHRDEVWRYFRRDVLHGKKYLHPTKWSRLANATQSIRVQNTSGIESYEPRDGDEKMDVRKLNGNSERTINSRTKSNRNFYNRQNRDEKENGRIVNDDDSVNTLRDVYCNKVLPYLHDPLARLPAG